MLVVSCSLNPSSRSHLLALAADAALDAIGARHDLIDLRDWDLPICDGTTCYDHPSIDPITEKVAGAAAVLIAAPVYNYDLNAAVKNLVELTGNAWAEKPVGFLCAAGGQRSYMAPMGLANSLMFDFRSYIIPRYVYAATDDFTAQREPDAGADRAHRAVGPHRGRPGGCASLDAVARADRLNLALRACVSSGGGW